MMFTNHVRFVIPTCRANVHTFYLLIFTISAPVVLHQGRSTGSCMQVLNCSWVDLSLQTYHICNNYKQLIVLAGTFAADGAQSKLIQDRTGNIAAADTPRFAAANLVTFNIKLSE